MEKDGQGGPAGLRLFLAGDVMTGRGIDQILPHPVDPRLYEGWVTSAEDYVDLAERRSGPIPRGVPFPYVWGDLLGDLSGRDCDLRIVNLETAITRAATHWPKGINYRMSPENAGVLSAAQLDACTLANNHVLDWGDAGLIETLEVLEGAGIGQAGAGRSAREAEAPLVLEVPGKGRVLVIALGSWTSGVPERWQAGPDRPGIALLPDLVYRPWSLEGDRIESRDVSGALPVVQVGMVWRKGSPLSAAAKDFISIAKGQQTARER